MKEPNDVINNLPAYYRKGGVASVLKQYDLFKVYQQQGWNGLPIEAQNAINQSKTSTQTGMIFCLEMLLLKNIISVSREEVKKLLTTTRSAILKKMVTYQE